MVEKRWVPYVGAVTLLLLACEPASGVRTQAGGIPATAAERRLESLTFERLEDSAASRESFPFLAEPLDEAAAYNREFPDAVPSEVHVAMLDGERTGSVVDLVVVQLRGSLFCGSAGCPTWVVGIGPERSARTLVTSYSHPSSPPDLSTCGDSVSLLVVTGHGMTLDWTEWRMVGDGIEEVGLGVVEDGMALPPCPA